MDDKLVLFDFYFDNKISAKRLISHLKYTLSQSKNKGIIAFVQENAEFATQLQAHGFISNPFSKGPLSAKVPFIFYTDTEGLKKYNVTEKWLIHSFDHDAM